MSNLDYQAYLASREWAVKKEAVRRRCNGVCERCRVAPYQSTHHLTYANIGNEKLEELLGVCEPCHKYLSAKSDYDPKIYADHIRDVQQKENELFWNFAKEVGFSPLNVSFTETVQRCVAIQHKALVLKFLIDYINHIESSSFPPSKPSSHDSVTNGKIQFFGSEKNDPAAKAEVFQLLNEK